MLGPTRFSGVLKECKKWVEECKDPKMFHVVLILTDGDIHDLKETMEEIIDASKRNLPMSIIIVGVGNEDFSSMVRLDGDDYALQEGVADIVQFVKYSDVLKKSDPSMVDQNLVTVILEEIPN